MLKRALVALAAIAGIAVTASLGFWQWGRGQERTAMQEAIEARERSAPVPVQELVAGADAGALLHRPVVLRGEWIADRTVFLDNRQMNAVPGFYVVTPLRVEGTQAVVLVQRGWVQRDFEQRARLPAVQTPAGTVEVRGRLAPPPAKLYAFATEEKGPIRQNLDLAAFRAETGLPLLPVSVQQVGAPSEGLLRQWPAVGSGAGKNFGYAFQWWAMAALIAILYVWFQLVVPRRPARRP
ncbi:SURF1 family protein [Ramlibacter sp. USB13]|uniref:SURF1-like protein n=1 Tax=Ramlibacter cellulosilyticus TaxID=2764187 RepID=A0A923MV47_9BURK|nr:SURF1 family protein [Ramlibacter cellulosilyticus]MBC5785283.1 SURF1 family protein [Ramlibacter cellulosilyticus]